MHTIRSLLLLPMLIASLPVDAAATNDPAFDAGFRAAFRDKFIERCIASARAAAQNAPVEFTTVCTCGADTLLAAKPVDELMRGVSEDDGKAVMTQCLARHPFR
jgi:hypothetical protein